MDSLDFTAGELNQLIDEVNESQAMLEWVLDPKKSVRQHTLWLERLLPFTFEDPSLDKKVSWEICSFEQWRVLMKKDTGVSLWTEDWDLSSLPVESPKCPTTLRSAMSTLAAGKYLWERHANGYRMRPGLLETDPSPCER